MAFFRKLGQDLRKAGESVGKAGEAAGRGLQKTGADLGRGLEKTGNEVGKAGQEVGKAIGSAGREVGSALGKAGKEGGRVLETVVKEPVRIVQDLIDVDVDVLTSVALDLSSLFETRTWVSAAYKDHVVKARSELGKLVSESVKGEVRKAICGALDGSLGSLHSQLPDLSEQLLGKIPVDAPFHGELRASLQERATSSSWSASFQDHGRVTVSSRFCLNDLLESLIAKALKRERLDRDILDLAAQQGLLSGNLFDLFPDLRGQLLQAVEQECAGMRRPLQESLDAFSARECWDARIPERNKVKLASTFTLHELIERTCSALTEADVREMRPWLRRRGGMLTDALPTSGVLLLAKPALAAFLPGALADQPSFVEWTDDFMGAMTVDISYPKQTDDVFGFLIGFDFKHVVAQITTNLFKGLPRSLSFDAGALGQIEAALEYPAAGEAGISAQVALKDKQLPGIIESVVAQNKDQIVSAIPVKVAGFSTSTTEKSFSAARWTCVNKIQLSLKVVG